MTAAGPKQRLVIAVDGPAAAGKGTLSRRLADHFGLAHLDTGRLYRAVAARLLAMGGDPDDPEAATAAARALTAGDLARNDLRSEAVGNAASLVAAVEGVRQALLDYQRAFAANPPEGKKGAVLDGRDVGTVVLPDAPVKLFVTASTEARAERRFRELRQSGTDAIREVILKEMQERDRRDKGRSFAPLKAAPDAFLLDTTSLDADAAFEAALAFVHETLSVPGREGRER